MITSGLAVGNGSYLWNLAAFPSTTQYVYGLVTDNDAVPYFISAQIVPVLEDGPSADYSVSGATGNQTLDVTAGAITFLANISASLPDYSLKIESGAEVLLATNQSLGSLNIIAGGILDLQNNQLIVDYGTNSDPIASIASLIKYGYADGAWDGTGIISSDAALESGTYGVGYADSADPGNPADLASGTIEIRYTLFGDANLDDKVNGTDFNIMAANFNQAVTDGWDQGDFNYDGKVNGTDFTLMANNFNQAVNLNPAGLVPGAGAEYAITGSLGRRRWTSLPAL